MGVGGFAVEEEGEIGVLWRSICYLEASSYRIEDCSG